MKRVNRGRYHNGRLRRLHRAHHKCYVGVRRLRSAGWHTHWFWHRSRDYGLDGGVVAHS